MHNKNLETVMTKILSHMMEQRPEKEVTYHPYYAWRGMKEKPVLKGLEIDFEKLYPQIHDGNKVYIKALIEASVESEAFLNLSGNHIEAFYNGCEIHPELCDGKGDCYRIRVTKEPQELVIGYMPDAIGCKLELVLSTVYYRGMAARDYLNHISLLTPYGGNEEGIAISGLHSSDADWTEAVFEPPFSRTSNSVAFLDWYENEKGRIAYAAAKCQKAGRIRINPQSECRVLINGDVLPDFQTVHLNENDFLLIKSKRNGKEWGFTYEDPEEILALPVPNKLDSAYGSFLLVGAFGEDGVLDTAYGPELQFGLKRPYTNADSDQCYWVFPAKATYLRPRMSTHFFGQWFYALMVGSYGIRTAAKRLRREDLLSYFMNNMNVLAGYYGYMKYDAAMFGDASFLQRSVELDNLDSIGAIGLCLAEAYKIKPDPDTLDVLYALANAAGNRIPRFSDGTYHREDTMWTDDLFMSLPFLARMGEITGDTQYYEECVKQIKGFQERLYLGGKKLFSHIYFLKKKRANGIPWGRGNGWIFMTLSDLLRRLPMEYRAEITALYREFASGIAQCQDCEGMWRQVLDDPGSYRETSCTGMFITGLAYGISEGVLEDSCMEHIRKGMEGLLKHSVSENGAILGVCRGSSCSMEREYYKQLGTVDDDDHGTGIVLLAMDAVLEAEERLRGGKRL